MLGIAISIMLACGVREHVWSLEECISCALDNDPGLKQDRLTLERCRSDAALRLLDWLPDISVYAGNDFSWGRSVDMQELMIIDNRMNYTASASAALSFSSSGKAAALYGRRAGRQECRLAEAGLRQSEAQLICDVTAAYLQLLLAEQACGIARRNCEDILGKLEKARVEVKAGRSAQYVLDGIMAQAAGEKSALTRAEGSLKLAIAALYNCMNLPPEEDLDILPPTEDFIEAPDRTRLAELLCLANCPERDAAHAALERDRARLKAAEWAFVPDLGISFGYGTYYGNSSPQTFAHQFRSNGNPSLGISLSIPILNGSAAAVNLNGLRSEVTKDELELQKVMSRAEHRAYSDATETVNLYESWTAARENLRALEENHRSCELLFAGGRISPVEYLSARNDMLRAEAECLQARYRYLLQLKILEYRYGVIIDGSIR